MDDLFRKRVVLITGKGGVGRTTMSAALAIAAARRGLRVLVTEVTDPDVEYTPLARLFGRDRFPPDPESIAPGIQGCVLWARRGHEAFFHRTLRVGPLVNAAMASGALRKMLEATPSLSEMGVFYHLLALWQQERSPGIPEHELILVDMPASGHTLGLTGLPERVLEVMPKGPIARAMREGQALMYDPAFTASWVVTLPEVLPVSEALELLEGLRSDKLPIGGVLLNRFLEDPFTREERAALEPALEGREVYGKARFLGAPRSKAALERLSAGTQASIHRVPELEAQGRALLDEIADVLLAEDT